MSDDHETGAESSVRGGPADWFWGLWEAGFCRWYGLMPVGEASDGLFAVSRSRHHGAAVHLADGVVVRSGDPLLEVHFRRETLLAIGRLGSRRGVLQLRRLMDRDMPLLAEWIAPAGPDAEVVALHALSMFHRSAERWGWEARPIESPLSRWWFSGYHRLLMARDHPEGRRRLGRRRAALVSQHLWISGDRLRQRYGQPPQSPGVFRGRGPGGSKPPAE